MSDKSAVQVLLNSFIEGNEEGNWENQIKKGKAKQALANIKHKKFEIRKFKPESLPV